MELDFSLVHDGAPVSKSRARVSQGHAYTPRRTEEAQQVLAWAIKLAMPKGYRDDGEQTYAVEARFFMPSFHRIDVDNLLKLVLDAGTGIVWKDDIQVVEVHGYITRQVPNPRSEIRIYSVPSPHPSLTCEHCGKSFRLPASQSEGRRFCTKACQRAAMSTAVAVQCVGCSRTVKRIPAKVVENPYCSVACRTRHTAETRACAHCGSSITRPRSQFRNQPRAYCSYVCREAFWREHRKMAAQGQCVDCGGPTSKKSYVRCQSCEHAKKREAA